MSRVAVLAVFLGACGLTLDPDSQLQRDAGIDARGDTGRGDGRTDAADAPDAPLDTGTVFCTADTDCPDDGDPCNGAERCEPFLGCISEGPIDCDDRIACTVDSCDAAGCSHSPDDTLCVLGRSGICDLMMDCQYPTCDATTCIPGPCQTARCDGATCIRTDLCSSSQTCCAGTCVAAGCNDGDPCTADACVAMGCLHGPALDGTSCDDGNRCTMTDRCTAGLCIGASRPCDDGNPCTMDGCNPTTGLCASASGPAGVTCGVNAVCDNAGRCECGVNYDDCDGDGGCECFGRCVGLVCNPVGPDCSGGATCLIGVCCADSTHFRYETCGASVCPAPTAPGCCPDSA